MDRGRIEQFGTPSEIYNRPKTPFVARFIGDTNLFSGKVAAVDGGQILVEVDELATTLRAGSTPGTFRVGDRISLTVRPENVKISPAGPGVDVGLTGLLEEVIYAGAHLRCRLQVNLGEVLANLPAGPSHETSISPGAVLAIGWNPDDCVVQPSLP
jgi:ABC-type Fe3+/spermidine/putrescine transport system ATPase subunit